MWADLVDSIKTNHGGATVKVYSSTLEISMGGVTIVATPRGGGIFEVDVTGQQKVKLGSAKEVYYHVTDELNRIWAQSQKPRTSPGGPSYSGGGGGDGDDLVVGGGDLYEPSDDDD